MDTLNSEMNGRSNGNTHVSGHTNGHVDSQVNGHTLPNGGSHHSGSDKIFAPIAICGMACRLPGNISNPEELWNFLATGGDARGIVPKTRWSPDTWYSPTKKKGFSNTQHGYFLDESVDIGALDTAAFPMPKSELERMDPQQKLILEVARECLDDAGEVNWEGSDTGVFVGCFGQDWNDLNYRENLKWSQYQITGGGDFMVSERVSHQLDLHGPCMTIRTACSSSMIALNDACMAVAKGDCTAAIVGGTSLHLSPATLTGLAEAGIFSPDGSSKTFSANANGFARGEGIVAIHIKNLDDAIRDGNAIRAVIRGVSTNSDGRTPTMGRPVARTQVANIKRAYEVAGISDYGKTGLFECHGTGTAAGDPIETSALAAIFGEDGIYISSVKPNLGHSEGAAGITGVAKAVLALEHSQIPPSIKAWPLNPEIPFEKNRLTVASELTPWPAGRHERVSVNSFGFAGSNGHAIIDSARSFGLSPEPVDQTTAVGIPALFIYSAYSDRSLDMMAETLENFLEATSKPMADVAYTLSRRRRHLPKRGFIVSSKLNPGKAVHVATEGKTVAPTLVMVFTGQGAQWPQMGRDLIRNNKVFAETIQVIDAELLRLGADWNIEEELKKNSRTTRVNEAEYSQPLCTAIQIALLNAFACLGVRPAAVVGHSSGEIAAAYAAGALTLVEAVAVAFHRGKVSKLQSKPGAMAAIGLSWEDTEKLLKPGVVIACYNSHNSVTISGDAEAITSFVSDLREKRPEVQATVLKVERAYHSHHMVEIGEGYHQAMTASGVIGSRPTIPFFSSVSGSRLHTLSKQSQLGPRYWQSNLENPVLFKPAIVEILMDPDVVDPMFLEIGPHGALEGPIRQILTKESQKAPYTSTLTRRQSGTEGLLHAVGKLWSFHVDIDFSRLMPTGQTLHDLPCYPWDHQKTHWYEPRVAREWRLGGHVYHNLLGMRLPESTVLEPVWRNLLHLDNVPWISDHRLENDIVFPFAGFLAIAVEAVQQIAGSRQTGVDLRNVVINSPLPINEETPTELLTALRRCRLTDSQDSEWWDFTISAHNGNDWTRHCVGQVCANPSSDISLAPAPASTVDVLPRKVDGRKWYDALGRKGLYYGPQFTSMESITTTVASPSKASATLQNNWHGDELDYALHPVVIDAFFQLQSVATYNGQARLYRRLVPTGLDQMTVFPCSQDQLQMSLSSESTKTGVSTGTGYCASDTGVVAQCSGVRMTVFEASGAAVKTDFPLTARSEWVPHIEYSDFGVFSDAVHVDVEEGDVQAFEKLVTLAFQHAHQVVRDSKPEAPHLQKYQSWLSEKTTAPLQVTDTSDLLQSIEIAASKLISGSFETPAIAIRDVSIALESILNEQREVQDLLAADGMLDKLIDFMCGLDSSRLYHELGLFKPKLRVLELGAGTGTRTAKILQALRHEKGQRLFSRYVLADTSMGLLDVAKTRFKDETFLEYTPFLVERDFESQGFSEGDFDVIISAGALHRTKNIGASLSNIRRLLSPQGIVLWHEPLPGSAWAKFVCGALPGWWFGEEDSRSLEPFIDQPELLKELAANDLIIHRSLRKDQHICQSLVLLAQPNLAKAAPKKVTVISGKATFETEAVCDQLQAEGYEIVRQSFEDPPMANHSVLVLVDLESPFFWDLTEARLKLFQQFIAGLQGSSVLWVTRQSQAGVQDPRYSPIIGLARTMRTELAAHLATCEVDDLEAAASATALVHLFASFQDKRYDGVLAPDYEFSITNGEVLVSRLFPLNLDAEIQEALQSPEASLVVGKPGQLASLYWSGTACESLLGDQIEVEVHAAGLNFRDVLVASGILSFAENTFGCEAAGVVRRLGPNATKFHVGDRVFLMSTNTFATSLVLSEMLCERVPDSLNMVDAAATPLVFLTAMYSLIDVGRLEEGQSVLIHSAAGGVGIAAIQVSRMLKANVYVTVSTIAKRRFLVETLGIPDENIFDSRSTSFVADIMRQTSGRGVDIVLNSLAGELLHATWSCVAKWGKLVEIGKRDLMGSGKLNMKPFLDNRSYCCVDIDQMARERPEMVAKLLRRLVDHLRSGQLHPVPIDQVFPAHEIGSAMRHMQHGKHIGKIVLQLRDDAGHHLTETQAGPKGLVELEQSAAYLLLGGLGGLGRAVALYMAERGARHLVFLQRSANDPKHRQVVMELESLGVNVRLVQGNAANRADIERAIDEASAPIKGVLNLTITLADEAFLDMSIDSWNICVDPKIKGSWNVLEVIRSRALQIDFLILMSSFSGVIGQAGQANYASANTFLDAFSQYSTEQGVPCTSIIFGVMDDIGVMSDKTETLRRLQASGWRLNNESELLAAVDSAIQLTTQASGKTPASIRSPKLLNKTKFLFGLCPTIPLDSPEAAATLRTDVRMAVYHNSKVQNQTLNVTQDALRSLIGTAKKTPAILQANESVELLAIEIGKKFCSLMLLPTDKLTPSMKTADLGLDSLVAVEISAWWKVAFGVELSTVEIVNMGTLEALGRRAADGLVRLYSNS